MLSALQILAYLTFTIVCEALFPLSLSTKAREILDKQVQVRFFTRLQKNESFSALAQNFSKLSEGPL